MVRPSTTSRPYNAQLNPYINYPFLTLDPLREYIREAHARGARVKLYYTVRERSRARAHGAHRGTVELLASCVLR